MEENLPQPQVPVNPVPVNPASVLPAEPPPTKRFPVKWILIVVFIVVILSAGTYIVVKNQSNKPTPPSSTQLSPTLTPTPTPTPTANWKTYTNTKYGFTFKHPNLISVLGLGWPLTGDPERLIALAEKDSVVEESDVPFNGFAISIESNIRNFSLEEYVFSETEAVKNHYTCVEFKGIENIDVNDIIKGVRITCEEGNHSFLDEFVFMFPNTKQILIFARLSQTKGSFEVTFNQILSTFKFLGTTPSPTSTEGQFCGGIAGIACLNGYTCQLDGSYPDAGGKCIKVL